MTKDPRQRPAVSVPPQSSEASAPQATIEPAEPVRVLSSGVPAPPGSDVSAISSTNPFSFPDYVAPELEATTLSKDEMPRGSPEPMELDESEGADATKTDWDGFVRTLSEAIRLSTEERALNETKKQLDETMHRLQQYPVEGLPAPSPYEEERQEKISEIRVSEASIRRWMAQVPAVVESSKANIQILEQKKQEIVKQKKRIEEEERVAAAAAAAVEAAAKPLRDLFDAIQKTSKKVSENMFDLESYYAELRETPIKPGDAINDALVERNIVQPGQPPRFGKSSEELVPEIAYLAQMIDENEEKLQIGLQQVKELREYNVILERTFHSLAADNADLTAMLQQLTAHNNEMAERADKNEEVLRALRTELAAAQTSTPMAPVGPTPEDVMQEVLRVVLPEIKESLSKALMALKSGVEGTLLSNQTDLCSLLMETVPPMTRTVGVLKRYLDEEVIRNPALHAQTIVPPIPPVPTWPAQSAQH
ncbi:uncharacterized protein BXZ73DRAFT_95448 [Epithele typhae]|uniref:uncharacterized protein n=1 Tax=Epithele typhae TaxID=378194 RepID=UPI002008724C|nr:uncharacterized protein BXZ73DRAFT_95448 [Epithele typhae]KAH9945927.1 hypothetical protein BXZ73DRAFT_95448 [Epithele typhae]